MLNVVKEMMVTGLGAVFLTRDKIKDMVDQLVEQGKLSREEAEEMVEDMMTKAQQQRKELEEKITDDIKDNLNKTGLTNQEKIKELENRIKNLELQVESLEQELEASEEADDA